MSKSPVINSAGFPQRGRNFVTNGALNIWQRGTTSGDFPTGNSTYFADMWIGYAGEDGITVGRSSDVPVEATAARSLNMTANGPTNAPYIRTPIELTLSGGQSQNGKPFIIGDEYTVSFWMKCDPGGPVLFESWWVDVANTSGNRVSDELQSQIGTNNGTWQKYTHTFVVGQSYPNVTNIAYQLGFTGGEYPGEAYITSVQFEKGSSATPFEDTPYQEQLDACQRYFWAGYSCGQGFAWREGDANSSDMLGGDIIYNTQMRIVPSSVVTLGEGTYSNCSHSDVVASNAGAQHRVNKNGSSGLFRVSLEKFQISAEL
jgi:hypothetical protein